MDEQAVVLPRSWPRGMEEMKMEVCEASLRGWKMKVRTDG